MAEGRSIGTIFVELDLDPSRYTKGQQKLLKDATSTSLSIEENFKKLNIKSSAEFDLMRLKASNAYEQIKNSAQATANDIVRAEQAKNAKLSDLHKQQFGTQTSLLEGFKKNWLAVTAALAGVGLSAGVAIEMMKMGAAAKQTEDAFMTLASRAGESGDAIVAAMKKATAGTIDDSDMMQKAIKGMALGLSGSDMTKIAEMARQTARVTGESIGATFEKLSDAISTNMPKALKQMGLITKEQMKVVEEALSKGVEGVNLLEIAYANFMVQQRKMGPILDNEAESVQRLNARWNDLKETVGQGMVRTILALIHPMEQMNESVKKFGTYGVLPMKPEQKVPELTESRFIYNPADRAIQGLKDQIALVDKLKKDKSEAASEEKEFIREIEKLSLEAQKTIEAGDMNQWKNMEKLLYVRKREEEQAAEDRMKMYRKLGEEEEKSWEFIPTKIKESTDEWQTAISGWANGFSRDLNDAVWDADFSFSKIAQSFAKMITQMVIQTKIIQPMLRKLFELDSSSSFDWVGSILKLGGSMAGGASESTAAGLSGEGFLTAHGAVFDNGLVPFASGGVVSGPKIFQFAGGVGMMGENGPEAIMPLTRTRTGDLGVKSAGGGGLKVEIHNYNESQIRTEATPDGSTLRVFVERVALDTMRKNTGAVAEAWNSEARGGNKALRNTIRRLS